MSKTLLMLIGGMMIGFIFGVVTKKAPAPVVNEIHYHYAANPNPMLIYETPGTHVKIRAL